MKVIECFSNSKKKQKYQTEKSNLFLFIILVLSEYAW